MSEDDWVKAALDDDILVGKILVTLRQASPSPTRPPPSLTKPDKPAPPSGWSVRQRRSRSQTLLPASVKKPAATTRASPTTPLSWSGATSISGGGVGTVDGVEESSQPTPNRCDISRSKVMLTTETTPTKRPRKKKTLADLKEDETTLLKERKHLKRQIAILQATCEKKRIENEGLKKMKLDLQSQPEGERPEAVSSGENQHTVAASEAIPLVNNCSDTMMELMNKEQEDKFFLPDLNIPVGDDIS